MTTLTPDLAASNQLLGSLPEADLQRLMKDMRLVHLKARQNIYNTCQLVQRVYFPYPVSFRW